MAILSTALRDLVGPGTPRRIVAFARGSGARNLIDPMHPNGIFEFNITRLLAFVQEHADRFQVAIGGKKAEHFISWATPPAMRPSAAATFSYAVSSVWSLPALFRAAIPNVVRMRPTSQKMGPTTPGQIAMWPGIRTKKMNPRSATPITPTLIQ